MGEFVPLSIDAAIFDLDGTVYLGEAALPGAVDTIRFMRQAGIRTLFVSNKPLEPRLAYAEKLTRLGIPTPPEQVLTSAFILGSYLKKHAPELKLYVVGEESLRDELREYGLSVLPDPKDGIHAPLAASQAIDAVVVAFDRTLDYRKLNMAYQALLRGARFMATNSDKVCPVTGGSLPDAGATLAALEAITGRKVELLAGKPSPLILQVALETLDVSAERCLMVGDRLETDIRMGRTAGMRTALVLTGITTRAMLTGSPDQPDFVLNSLADLHPMLQKGSETTK